MLVAQLLRFLDALGACASDIGCSLKASATTKQVRSAVGRVAMSLLAGIFGPGNAAALCFPFLSRGFELDVDGGL